MLKIMEADPTKQLKDAISNTKFLLTGNNEGELLPDVELMPVRSYLINLKEYLMY